MERLSVSNRLPRVNHRYVLAVVSPDFTPENSFKNEDGKYVLVQSEDGTVWQETGDQLLRVDPQNIISTEEI